MSDFLASMGAASRARVRDAKARVGEASLYARASTRPAPPKLRFDASGFDILAEFKPRSPTRGVMLGRRRGFGPRTAAAFGAAYERGGALAVSVLTEPTAFGGSLVALAEVAANCGIPTMRKDFLVDPYQVIEARAHGAGGVLLIASLLDATRLREMLDTAASMDLFALIESFDVRDLDRAVHALEGAHGTVLLGVNARDLVTHTIDAARHARLAPPAAIGARLVAESGIVTRGDAARVASVGYSVALVGEALMLAPDPTSELALMIVSGREAASVREVQR